MIDRHLSSQVSVLRSDSGFEIPGLYDAHRNLSLSQSSSIGSSSSALTVNAAVSAEGVISLNQRVSFAGDKLNLADDALIYAGQGVNINQVPEFSLVHDLSGSLILDRLGRTQVRENSLMLGTGYGNFNFPNDPFSDAGLPKVVAPRTIEVPDYSSIKQSVLTQVAPASSVFSIVNPTQTSINSIADVQRLIPNGGSASQPKLIRVAGGGLNLPEGVVLENLVIVVESGDINFNGSTSRLKNVTLIAEHGSINLGSVQAESVAILASQSIHMNREARFTGRSLIANGDCNGIIFNGATVNPSEHDYVTVISQGRLTFNASSDTRGLFLSRGDFSFNSSVELVGAIQTKGNLFFNGAGSVRAADLQNGLDDKPDENVPNIRPRFISNPVLEAIVRQAYRYDADAIDADGDALTYSLMSGPEGLTIDARTGVISWSPATQTAGSYQTTIQVVDGRGGRDEQTFTLNLSNLSIKDDPGLLYLQDFEKPTGFSNDGGDVNIYKGVNQLYGEQPAGFSFAQVYTVETLLVGGNQAHRGAGFRDPQGVAGRYVLGMLSDMQNDLLGLSFNIGSFKFLNFQLDLSPIVPDWWRGNSVDTRGLPPTFRISLYDNPTSKTALGSGKALDFIDIVGLTSPSRSLFNWSNHTIALDTSGNTNGNVILQLDLLTGGYAAMDNFRVVASDVNFGLVKAA